MGALKIPLKTIANNANFKGSGLRKPTTPFSSQSTFDTLVSTVASSTALNIASKVLPRLHPALLIGSLLYQVGSLGYSAYQNYSKNPTAPENVDTNYKDEQGKKSPIQEVPERAIKEVVKINKQKVQEVKYYADEIISTFNADTSTTLPDVMKANTLALTQSINNLANVMSSSLNELNTNIFGLSIQMNQSSQLQEFGQAQNQLQKALEYSLKKDGTTSDIQLLPTDVMSKVSSMLDLQIPNLTHSNEDFEYKKGAVPIKDLDGNTVTNQAPRDIEMMKNASDTRKATDENNFELDDEDFDIMDMIPDLSSMFEHTTIGTDLGKIFRNEEL
jgi:hypothetical protein